MTREELEGIFPELKESEDEKIRKELISYINEEYRHTIDIDKRNRFIDYLERQGEQAEEILILKDQIESLHAAIKAIKETHKLELEKLKSAEWREDTDVLRMIGLIETYLNSQKHYQNAYGVAQIDKCLKWLDGLKESVQGLSHDDEPKFKVGDIIRHKEQGFTCKIIDVDTEYRLSECNGTHLPFDWQDAYELVEQKPTDKVKPKFRVGDTIYYNSFGELKSMIVANIVTDSTDNPMYKDKEGNAVFEKDIIEQKLAWSDDDEEMLNNIIAVVYTSDRSAEEIHWLKLLKDRVQPQTKQEWSEKDEEMLTAFLHKVEVCYLLTNRESVWVTKRLKSLRPQNTWKPSDE